MLVRVFRLTTFALLLSAAPAVAGDTPDANTDRVKRAKDLYKQGKTYDKGCSAFVAEVLQIPWQDANSLMGDNPTYVGVDDKYKDLKPGDIVGWQKKGGAGHVAIYVGEPDMMFIDVKDEKQAPRAVKMGYGPEKLYKSSKY